MADIYLSNDALLRDYSKLSREYKNKAGKYIKNLLKIQRAESGLEQEIQALTGEPSEGDSGKWQNIRCNFCGKRAEDVGRMIAGPGAYICNECIDLCSEILTEEGEGHEKTDHAEMGETEK